MELKAAYNSVLNACPVELVRGIIVKGEIFPSCIHIATVIL